MFLEHPKTSRESRLLDFEAQSEQLLKLLEDRIQSGHRDAAVQYLAFKFKTLYEQGVANGRSYERDEEFPY